MADLTSKRLNALGILFKKKKSLYFGHKMATTWPTVCRVLYETEPSPRCYDDDDPFIPYRYSLLKSCDSTNSQQQLKSRHARHHDNAIRFQASDRHGNSLDASNRHGNKDRDKTSYQRQNEDISREFHSTVFLLTEASADDEQRRERGGGGGGRGVGEEVNGYDRNESTNRQTIRRRIEEKDNKTKKKKKKTKERFIWDPINNAWISSDAADIDFIHFVNAMSLIDRGIYSTTAVMERKHKLFPCMEKHAKSFRLEQTMLNYRKYLLGMRFLKKKEKHENSLPRLTASERPKTASSSDWMLTTYHQDRTPFLSANQAKILPSDHLELSLLTDAHSPMKQREQVAVDCHSGRRHSTGSTDRQLSGNDLSGKRSTDEPVDAAGGRREVFTTEVDSGHLSIDIERTIANPDDFINVDGSFSESDDGSERSGITKSRSERLRKVRIGGGHQMSSKIYEDKQTHQPAATQEKVNQGSLTREKVNQGSLTQEKVKQGPLTQEKVNQGSLTQEKVNQGSLEGRSGPTDESATVLPPLRGRLKIKTTGKDSDDEGDKHADRFRHRQKAFTEDNQSSSAPSSPEHSDADIHGVSRISRPSLSLIAPANRLKSENEGRNLSKKRLSHVQRLRRKAAMRRGMLCQRTNRKGDEDSQQTDVDLRFEDYDWLAKYCILDPKTVTLCRRIFDEVDENKTGKLSCMQTMVALRASNYKLSEMQEDYMHKIMEMTGYEIEHGSDYKLFAVLSALSLKIAALDDWMKCLINKIDLKTLEEKLFVCKALWECTVDPETNTISLDDLCVELRAGGVSGEHEQNVREKLGHLHRLDLLDFLTYVPLFIMIHQSVIDNPLDDRRFK